MTNATHAGRSAAELAEAADDLRMVRLQEPNLRPLTLQMFKWHHHGANRDGEFLFLYPNGCVFLAALMA